jgi:Flp pilus assembly protein TadG
MKPETQSLLRRALKGQSGQVLPMVALGITAFLGMGALSIDAGHLFFSYRQLQSSTDAAALAGAAGLPNATTAANNAQAYGANTTNSGLNSTSNLRSVTTVSTPVCLTALSNSGLACSAPANANAIKVTQTVNVPMYFARVLGINTVPLSATSTASMAGSSLPPYDIMIVLDTTASMNTADNDTNNCTQARITCATQGVRTLLGLFSPCPSDKATCGTTDSNGNVTSPVDEVGLMVFPGLTGTSQVSKEYDCSNSNPSISAYNLGPNPVPPTYTIIPLSGDYRTSDSSALNTSSNFVMAMGGKANCTGLAAVGGVQTFYAGVINAAQAALVASGRANVPNVIIFLSDGDANSNSLSGYSTHNQCQQAIGAATAAKSANTIIYTVAYGASSAGCSTDGGNLTPCQTMRQIATSDAQFYSDSTASANSGQCSDASHNNLSGLSAIFQAIAGSLAKGRLISNSTT